MTIESCLNVLRQSLHKLQTSPRCDKPEWFSPVTAALWKSYMHSSVMYDLHIVSILVYVDNRVKYSVYHPIAGEVCWDAEVMKCCFLPLSPLLALFPLFCRWSGTVVSTALLIPGLDTHWAGRQAWICLNHPLPLPVPRRANNPPWADTDDGKQHSRTSEKQEGSTWLGYYYSFPNIGAVDGKKSTDVWSQHNERTHTIRGMQLYGFK